jgi:hypothetical protein
MRKSILILTAAVCLTFSSCTTDNDTVKLFPVKAGDKWGYVDNKGQYVINSQFEEAYNFSEGLALFKSIDGKYGFIGLDGKYVINPIYKDANSFSEGLACVVMENGKPQFIDKDNKILFSVDKAEYCFGFKEGLAIVSINGNWGFIDKTGKVVVNPIYENVRNFKDGLAAVAKKDEKKEEVLWGYIDKTGAIKINFQFVSDIEALACSPGSFNEGLAFTSSDGKQWGCIDKDGKYQINPQFEGVNGNPYKFINGVSLVSQGGSYGFIDRKGKYTINPQFKNVSSFSSNNFAAAQHSDGKWGFINKEGKYEINPQFEEVVNGFFGNVAFVKSSGKYGIIDKKGLYIANPQFDDVFLYDIGLTYPVKSDYVDYNGIAELIFEKSNSTQFLGYDKSTTLGQVIDDYPNVDISDFEPYFIVIRKPNIKISDIVEIGSLRIGFDENTYTKTPIYKTVKKYSYSLGGYFNDKEFVRMDKKIQYSTQISFMTIDFILQSTGKMKGKNLAEAIKNQASKIMKVTELSDLAVKNTDFKGQHILKGDNLLVFIRYSHEKDDENSKPSILVAAVNKNNEFTFDEFAKELAEDFYE